MKSDRIQTVSFHSAWIVGDAAVTGTGAVNELFPWWSFTKSVLAFAALRLVEAGKLELDELLADRPYTLRQLLLHRAGVPNYGRLESYHEAVERRIEAWSRERLLSAVGAEKLDFEPGSQWSYSNVGYLFVLDAIEKASDLPLGDALHRWVLTPLDLSSVRLATKRSDFGQVFWHELRNYDPQWVYHGCLIGTPMEAARLLHSVFTGKLLKPKSINAIFERSTVLNELPGRPWIKPGYALGVMTGSTAEAGRAWGHTGGGPHSTNAVYYFPDMSTPITVAAFSNAEIEGPVEFEALSIAVRMEGR